MTVRYLLFDSGCHVCAGLAAEVVQIAAGRLTARSLSDPEMRQMLERTRPNARWEPTLIEVRGHRVAVYVGRALTLKLASVLGIRRAWAASRLLSTVTTVNSRNAVSRRAFLGSTARWTGGAIGALILGKITVSPALAATQPSCQEQCRQFYVNCASNCAARYKACVARGGSNCQEEHGMCVGDCQATYKLCLKNC
jgi:hypothetical protein